MSKNYLPSQEDARLPINNLASQRELLPMYQGEDYACRYTPPSPVSMSQSTGSGRQSVQLNADSSDSHASAQSFAQNNLPPSTPTLQHRKMTAPGHAIAPPRM
ncbi:hypothetical protein BZG36_03597 [Bifiguratus adelaidae]|uniref:Uncharacterized protein n=1 Tax=Bifiguratus adelaidae TaxID=1938954 RepID=A0A261XYG3_9FUNG|nr:hypothetical protein BZG36_03597 [Bifiguratus adelaidae]